MYRRPAALWLDLTGTRISTSHGRNAQRTADEEADCENINNEKSVKIFCNY